MAAPNKSVIIMRLQEFEIRTIEETVHALDPEAAVYLFGSRADDSRKGGDIDLLIISPKLTYSDKLKIKRQFFEKMEEQKIDVVIAKDAADPFVRMALEQGRRLQ
ncbi:MAG: nucleotidyltransferase domain-containing protein [Syntrophales bacterium]|nr:nucleotidyltransferase domain-containing protein [Syntrophales bacterium]